MERVAFSGLKYFSISSWKVWPGPIQLLPFILERVAYGGLFISPFPYGTDGLQWSIQLFPFLMDGKSGIKWPIQFTLSLWREWPTVAYYIFPFLVERVVHGGQYNFPFLVGRVAYSGLYIFSLSLWKEWLTVAYTTFLFSLWKE